MLEAKRGGLAKEPLTINVEPDSDLAHVLGEVDDSPVVLERNGARYTVTNPPTRSPARDDPFAGYDPAKIRAGLKRFAGLITPAEAERMKALVYRGREDGTRPLDRP